jgi:acetyl esterase
MPKPYPISTEMTAFVAKTLSFSSPSHDIAEQRAAYARMCEAFTPARAPDLEVKDFTLSGVAVRSYRPQRLSLEHPAPCVMYVHGGGWVVGDLDSHDFLTARLAADLNAVVIAVDYRLAPEHPFPAGFGDCLAVWHALQVGGWTSTRGALRLLETAPVPVSLLPYVWRCAMAESVSLSGRH